MGSLAVAPVAMPVDLSNKQCPEVDEATYMLEVLKLPSGVSETHLDEDLIARANSLGIAASTLQKRTTSGTRTPSLFGSVQERSLSSASSSAVVTPHSSVFGPPRGVFIASDDNSSQSQDFTQYDEYLTSLDSGIGHKFRKGSLPVLDSSSQSMFSVSTKKSFSSASGIKTKWWKKKSLHGLDSNTTCFGCRTKIGKDVILHALSCCHAYCSECLQFLVSQAMVSEATMPPRCCSQPLPATTLQTVMNPKAQQSFLKVVDHYKTPKECRIYCPNKSCGDFIPLSHGVDPQHPNDVSCKSCHSRVCTLCKADAHPIGQDCPQDWELEAMKKIGQKPAWKRCYSCRSLASLTKDSDHITCRCSAEMCHVCGSAWDNTTGCLNLCSDETEIERRRLSEEYSSSSEASESLQADRREAETRSKKSSKVQRLIDSQHSELSRFCEFSSRSRIQLQERQATEKTSMLESQTAECATLKEEHTKSTTALEDRQIAAEMELRATLEQSERKLRLRLKHMEAYCEGMGRTPGSSQSGRVVTERDLRELDQQYSLRDGMERQHQAKISVMRDRQAKRMEELLEKQKDELSRLQDKHGEQVSAQSTQFASEQASVDDTIRDRQIRLNSRWSLDMEVLCKELGEENNVKFAVLPTPVWPAEDESEQ